MDANRLLLKKKILVKNRDESPTRAVNNSNEQDLDRLQELLNQNFKQAELLKN